MNFWVRYQPGISSLANLGFHTGEFIEVLRSAVFATAFGVPLVRSQHRLPSTHVIRL